MLFGDFMMGARSRLLPPSLPFRFFGAAVFFHIAAWALLTVFADDAVGFVGGSGHVLAALHMITLGVLAMTAMGAAFQLLPVATKRPVRSVRACKAVFWLFVPGVAVLAHGMGHQTPLAQAIGGTLVVAALVLFGLLVADNLRRVSDMRVVTDHTWIALGSLALLGSLGAVLLADFRFGFLPDHRAVATAHGVIAAYGFMGMLAMGFSFILLPMFALSPPPDSTLGKRSAWLGGAALVLALAGLVHGIAPLVFVAGALGLGSAALHLRAMGKVLSGRMRKRLGDSFVLVRLAWVMMPLSIVIGLLAVAGVASDRTGPLFGFVLVFCWLLSFLMGVLQRIMPFLASMHSVRKGIKPVLVSALTADRPLRLHLICHCTALALVAAGILSGETLLVRIGAAAGLIGALSFASFAVLLWRRMRQHLNQVTQTPEK
jgi:hypothetical protein